VYSQLKVNENDFMKRERVKGSKMIVALCCWREGENTISGCLHSTVCFCRGIKCKPNMFSTTNWFSYYYCSTLVFAVIGSHDSIPSFQVFDCEKKVTHPSVFVLSVDIAKIILAERGAEVEATYYCYANRCYCLGSCF
jgi:hypothetical protein